MGMRWRTRVAASAAVLLTFAVVGASELRTRGGGGGAQGGPGTQTPAVHADFAIASGDSAAHDRGRALWASHCIECHGSQARGSETGPNIIRTKTVNFDQTSFTPGSVLGPFLKAGHPTRAARPARALPTRRSSGLAHFLRQRVNDTMRGSPLFTVADILVGDAKAGRPISTAKAAARSVITPPAEAWSAFARASPRRSICSSACSFQPGRVAGARPLPTTPMPSRSPSRPSAGPAVSGVLVEQVISS